MGLTIVKVRWILTIIIVAYGCAPSSQQKETSASESVEDIHLETEVVEDTVLEDHFFEQEAIEEETEGGSSNDITQASGEALFEEQNVMNPLANSRDPDLIFYDPDMPLDTALAEGIHARKVLGPQGERIILVELDSTFMPAIKGLTPKNENGISLKIAADTYEVAIGSGFVKSYSPIFPQGLLVIGGLPVGPLDKTGYNTVLIAMADRLRIESPADYLKLQKEVIGTKSSAMQIGPLLVRDGKPAQIREREMAATRGFIGMSPSGNYLLGVTADPILLTPLSIALSKYCRTCTNLSGGGAEGIIIKIGNKKVGFNQVSLRQASIVIFEREGDLD